MRKSRFLAISLMSVCQMAGAVQNIKNPHRIHSAVSIYVTTRGEQALSRNLEGLLPNTGVSLDEGSFPLIRFQPSKPIPLAQLAGSNADMKKMIETTRTLLEQWLSGFQIQDPQPNVVIKGGGYRMNIDEMNVSTDRAALAKLGKTTGVVLVLEAKVDHLLIGAESVMVSDPRNHAIGTVGILSPILSVASRGTALSLKIPVYISVDQKGLNVQILSAQTTMDQASLDLKYASLVVPDIALIGANGVRYPLNKQKMVDEFEALKPQMLNYVRSIVNQMVQSNLAKFATDGINKALVGKLDSETAMPAPGAPVGSKDPTYRWGLTLESIAESATVTAVQLSSYAEDRLHLNLGLDPAAQTRGPVSLAGANANDFDIALAVGRGLINRILQLSYARGYFKDVTVPGDKPGAPPSKLRMMFAPQMDTYQPTANQTSQQPRIVLKVGLGSPVTDFATSTMIDKEARFEINLIGKLIAIPGQKGLHIQMIGVDESTLLVHEETLTMLGKTFAGVVRDGVLKKLRSAVASWQKTPDILDGALPLPPELFGQTFETQGIRMDKNGSLILFLNFPAIAAPAAGVPLHVTSK